MTTDTHPQLEQLVDYLENPNAIEYAELRRHIAGCFQCRKQIDGLSTLSQTLSQAVCREKIAELPDNQIEDYIDGRLTNIQHQKTQTLLNENKDALKAALHYAMHSTAMREAKAETAQSIPKPASLKTQHKTQQNLLQRLLAWRPPALTTVPLAAAAAFALAITVVPLLDEQHNEKLVVAAFQDHAVLELQPAAADMPGMGFFHSSQGREIPFSGLRMQHENNTGLFVNWAAVESAQNYHLRLSMVTDEGTQIIAETDSRLPEAHFKNLKLHAGRHYQWALSGNTKSGLHFRSNGGFAVNEVKQQ